VLIKNLLNKIKNCLTKENIMFQKVLRNLG